MIVEATLHQAITQLKMLVMKNIILPFVFLFAIQISVFANMGSQALTVVNESSVLVNQKLFPDDIEFKVMSSKGKTVYQKNYKTSRVFELIVDLGQLSEGEYHIELTDQYKIMKMKARKNSEGSLSLQENTGVVYKPQFEVSDSYVDLYFNPMWRDTYITILDSSGNILHRDFVKKSGKVNKRYRIKNYTTDLYTIKVEIPNRVFTKQFEI